MFYTVFHCCTACWVPSKVAFVKAFRVQTRSIPNTITIIAIKVYAWIVHTYLQLTGSAAITAFKVVHTVTGESSLVACSINTKWIANCQSVKHVRRRASTYCIQRDIHTGCTAVRAFEVAFTVTSECSSIAYSIDTCWTANYGNVKEVKIQSKHNMYVYM